MAQKSIEWRFLVKQKIRLYQNRTVIRSVLNKKIPDSNRGFRMELLVLLIWQQHISY